MRDRGAVTSWRQRRTPLERVFLVVVAVLVLGVGGCYAVFRSANPRLNAEEYEQVRARVQQLGDDTVASAARALRTTTPQVDERSVDARSCSGAPDGFVKLTTGGPLGAASSMTPAQAQAAVVRAWDDLGLEVQRRDEKVIGETAEGSVRLSAVVLGLDGAPSGTRVSVTTGCFDVGADLAREVR